MLHGYKYRIYPTEEQKVKLAKMFGSRRFVYNLALDLREESYTTTGKGISLFNMIKRIKERRDSDLSWLKEVSSQAISFAVLDLYKGYKYFFEGISNHPQHHIKYSRQHFRDEGKNTTYDFERGLISVTKIRQIPCVFHRRFDGIIMSVSVEHRPSGSYYISVLVRTERTLPPLAEIETDRTLGIDVGLKNYVTYSDGEFFEPEVSTERDYKKLKMLQRRRSKKQKDSRQYRILSKRIAKQYEHIANRRRDKIHKLTHFLAYQHEATTICVEDLYVEGIKRNKNLANKVSDIGLGMFLRQLEYKCRLNGKNYIKISKFAPSSKMCSHCGYIYRELTLKDREWTCPECGTHHDRDINAAINIKHFGLSEKSPYPRYWGKVKPVEQPLAEDRSTAKAEESNKSNRCYTARRVRVDEAGKSRDNRVPKPLLRKR